MLVEKEQLQGSRGLDSPDFIKTVKQSEYADQGGGRRGDQQNRLHSFRGGSRQVRSHDSPYHGP